MSLNHNQANQIIQVITQELARKNKAGVVAVADAHGELLAFLRMDGAKLSSIAIAQNKAWTAARSQRNTLDLGKAVKDPSRGFDISYYGDPRFTGFGGGVPVKLKEVVIGAVAVSGLSQEEDEELAAWGIRMVMKSDAHDR